MTSHGEESKFLSLALCGRNLLHFRLFVLLKTMKRKNRAASASASPPEGKKKKVASSSENDPEPSTSSTKSVDYTSPGRVVESLLAVTDLESFFDETWEKKPHFVKRDNADFYGALFTKKDLEVLLKKEEIQFIEDVSLSRYVEGKTELLNEEGSRVNLKDIKAAGVTVQFQQPDRFKVCTFCMITRVIKLCNFSLTGRCCNRNP